MTRTSVNLDDLQNTGAIPSFRVLDLSPGAQDETVGSWTSQGCQRSGGRLDGTWAEERIVRVVKARVDSSGLTGLS